MYMEKKIPTNTITRDTKYLAEPTGNIYETVVILAKRANQIALAEKKELAKKLEDFRGERDTMDEVFENKEQIEISLPFPSSRQMNFTIALQKRTEQANKPSDAL